MKFKQLVWCMALGGSLTGLAFAQQRGDVVSGSGVEVGEPVTPVEINVDLRTLPIEAEWKPGMAIREAAKRQFYPLEVKDPSAPKEWLAAPDFLSDLQLRFDVTQGARADTNGFDAARVNIDNGSTGVSPGDPVVDVSQNHVVYGINNSGGTVFKIYDKAGALLAGPSTFKSLAPAGDPCATSVSDPIVLFDRLANRWFLLEMGGSSSANRLCAYVSKTENPVTGGWYFYGFSTPALPDYPHCNVWNNAYVCTNNESGTGAKVYAFDRANMLLGATARGTQRFTTVAKLAGYGFQALTPATFMGTPTNAPPADAPIVLARHNDDEAHAGTSADLTKDFIDLYSLNLNWTTPASSSITTLPRINITEFNSWFDNTTACGGYDCFDTVPQPGSTSRLDPIREVILNSMVYRNLGTYESIVGNFATNQNSARTGTVVDSGVRWFELRKSGAGNWALQQEGTFSPADGATHHLLGTIATDKQGNIGLGYNVTRTSAPTISASLKYTGRLAADPNGVMTQGENDIAIGAAAESSGRWGDYYQMAVDPSDDCTFWFIGMYRPTGSWATRASHFKFNSCGGTTTTYSISGTVSTSAGAGISGVTVSTGGASASTDANGNYTIAGLANAAYTITPSKSAFTFAPVNRAVTVSSANVTAQNFTGTPAVVNNQLTNGTPVNSSVNSTSANSDFKEFTIVVPSGASNLTIATSASSGDVDLYVKAGSAPTLSVYDCRPYTGTGNESCPFPTPSASTYFIRVYGYATGNVTFTLTASYSIGGSLPVERLSNGSFDSITTSTNSAPDGSWLRSAFTGTTFNTLSAGAGNARSGTSYALLGVNNTAGQTVDSKSTAIPAASTTATLSFYTSIVTAETGATVYDRLVVELVDASTNAVLSTLVTLSNADKTTNAATYVQRTYNIVSQKGKNVKVRFRSTADGSLATSFRVEDVSLLAN